MIKVVLHSDHEALEPKKCPYCRASVYLGTRTDGATGEIAFAHVMPGCVEFDELNDTNSHLYLDELINHKG